MKKKIKILLIFITLITLVGCDDGLIKDGFETPMGTLYLGLKPESKGYLGLKPETLDDLQEHRDKFEEENQNNTFRRDIGLAMMDKVIEIIKEKGSNDKD